MKHHSLLSPIVAYLLLLLLCSLCMQSANAQLKPSDVAVLYNTKSAVSEEIARHYKKVRGLEEEQLIGLSIPVEETISRKDFDSIVRPVVRKTLEQRGLAQQTRALVSVFDMPLRVAAPDSDDSFHEYKVDALRRRDIARTKMIEELQGLESLAGQEKTKSADIKDDQDLANRLQAAVRSLISTPPNNVAKDEFTRTVSGAIQRIAGITGITQLLRPNDGNPQATQYLNKQKEFAQSAGQQLQQLERLGAAKHRNLVYNITYVLYGGIGVLSRANKEVQHLSFKDADASFESELALLWWDTDMYPISNNIPNPWALNSKNVNVALPILLTSRLDGPSYEVVKGMIDSSIEAEKNGLDGTVYVDARGLKTPGDEYFMMDELLRSFGWSVRKHTDMDVYIENNEGLLEEAKDAAIYVGWYSVGKFVGDFSFAPGAIAYHIASSEAISVRDPNATGWCRNLLLRGVAATLGPVDEPYLDSFPAPGLFYGLLMTGKYSLVESYFLSSKYLSWRMTLFGDPLYNPWKNKPILEVADLKLSTEKPPTAPSEFDLSQAYFRRDELLQQRAALVESLTGILEKGIKAQ